MRKLFVIIFSLVGCHSPVRNLNPEGMYTCKFENEFSRVADTLLLQMLSGNYYTIVRHSGVSNNKKQLITEVWKLEFDENKNVFTEIKLGKIIIWDEDKQILIFGNREYKRE